MHPVTPAQFQHVADDAFDPLRVVENDAQQAVGNRPEIILAQQFSGMPDRRQGVPDLVRNCSPSAAREPPA